MPASSVAARTLRDRTPLAAAVGVCLAALSFALAGVAATLGDEAGDIFDDLPEGFQNLIGGAGGNYLITETFGLIAPVVVLAVAISGGVNAVAGEEDRGTAALLLTHPVTRRGVVAAKAAVLVTHVAAACALFLAGMATAVAVIDVDGFGPGDAAAATAHLLFLGIAFAMIALALGTVTGSTSTAMGIAIGAAVAASLVSALFPLVDGFADVEKISPWYYLNGADPLHNGVAAGHLAVLGGIAVVAFAVALFAVDRRDIGTRRRSRALTIPTFGRIARPHVGTVFAKTLSQRSTVIAIASGSLAALAVAVAAMYDGLENTLSDLSDELPGGFDTLVGTSDLGTPTGWIQAEMLSILAPLVLVAVAIVMGVGSIAGEDDQRTLGLVAATPLQRRRLVADSALAIIVAVAAIAVICWAGIVAGSEMSDLGLGIVDLVAAMTHITLLGIFFGAVALALSAATTRTTALRGALAIAIGTYLADWALATQTRTEDLAALSPWYYIREAQPLVNGANPTHLGILAAATIITFAAAVVVFERREISA